MDDLIHLLRTNARASTAELAKELGLSEKEVLKRIAKLESDGVILGYQAVVDTHKHQAGVVIAYVEVRITPERGGGFDRLAQRIAKFPEVASCYLMSGGYDLLVVVQGNTLQQIASFISEKLSTTQGILSTATRFQLKTYKENGLSVSGETRPKRLAVAP